MKLRKILSISFALLLSISLIGCSSSKDKPEATVNSFFSALQKSDLKTAGTYLVDGAGALDGTEEEAIIKLVFSKAKHKIVSSAVNGDNATLHAKITAPDLKKITGAMIEELMPKLADGSLSSEEDMNKLVEEYYTKALGDSRAAVTTTEVDIKLVKDSTKKTWLIKPDDALINAITGNMVEAFNEIGPGLQ